MQSGRSWRKNIIAAICFLVLLTVIYLLTRYAMGSLYTPEWAARNMFGLIAPVILVFAVLGKLWFSGFALGGYLLGLVAGELLGGFWRAPPSYHHYGWLIFICVFLISCAVGGVVQRKKGRAGR